MTKTEDKSFSYTSSSKPKLYKKPSFEELWNEVENEGNEEKKEREEKAMKRLMLEAIKSIGRVGENLNVTPETFYGNESEDPVEWFKNFNYAATANNWTTDERKIQIVPNYLRGQAKYWFEDNVKEFTSWER